MFKTFHLTLLLILIVALQTFAQNTDSLRRQIDQTVSGKNARAGVSIADAGGKELVNLNAGGRFPMQSVFKMHIGLAVLAAVDRGKLSLDQTIKIEKKHLLPNLYSPIREKYPNGAELKLAEILRYTVAESDNVGCELLLELLGGPAAVEQYFVENNFKVVSIKINEQTMQGNWDRQFENWTTPRAANLVLRSFYDNHRQLLSEKSHAFFWQTMRDTKTGANRLRGQLQKDAIVAHKTGTSGVNRNTGVTAAVNDTGIVFLPDGRYFFITVFVTDSKENAETNEKIIAGIAKAAWDHFASRRK